MSRAPRREGARRVRGGEVGVGGDGGVSEAPSSDEEVWRRRRLGRLLNLLLLGLRDVRICVCGRGGERMRKEVLQGRIRSRERRRMARIVIVLR